MRPAASLRVLIALVTLTAGLGSAACDLNVGGGDFSIGMVSGRATDQWSRSYTLAEGARFDVVNVNGLVQVEQGSGPAIEVRAERTAKAATDEAAKELLGRVEMVETRSADGLKLETKAPKRVGRGGVEVKYYIKVPAGVRVGAATTNGGIKLMNLSNAVVASTVNGGVEGEALGGSVEARTTNGGIDLTLTQVVEGGVKAETVNGGVAVAIPRDARADVSARVVNGGLSMNDLPIQVVGEQNRRRLEGKLNGGGPRIELGAVNGGVQLAGK
jgi:hypothetical protein